MHRPDTLTAQAQTAVTARQAAPAPGVGDAHARKHFKTEGENRFNWITYTGLGYFANVAISLAGVYWAERTHAGQSFIGALGRGFEKLGFNGAKAEMLGRKSFFLTGGFAVIPFMKWLEDKKPELVKTYNREIYGALADTDPTIRQSEHEVEQAPQQSWASLIIGRLLALVPFYITVGMLWDRDSWLARTTNPEQKPGKGWYFDRPISTVARDLGKQFTSRGTAFDSAMHNATWPQKLYHGTLRVLGKPLRLMPENKAAFAQIEQMEQHSPGVVKSVKKGMHDPLHVAMPYYAISEAITSAMVAWGLFVITRFTGPIFDRDGPEHPSSVAGASAEPTMNKPAREAASATPTAKVQLAEAKHEARLAEHSPLVAR